jgi:hypothetical protein
LVIIILIMITNEHRACNDDCAVFVIT